MTVDLVDRDLSVAEIAQALRGGAMVPYLGPGISAPSGPPAPMSPALLAEFFGSKVALPRRAIGNAWASAQHIESYRHRSTVTALMAEAFAQPVPPSPFHRWLAAQGVPLIIDSWYAGEMRQALSGRDDWIEVQGSTRAHVAGGDVWYHFYRPDGSKATDVDAGRARTLLYAPHGSVAPASNFLITDSDYVEVLTEIDIQTPIPEAVRDRRTAKSFLFLGCRFDDQMLRSYARQIIKRSADVHHAVLPVGELTRNEQRFLVEQNITPIDMDLTAFLDALVAAQ